MEASGGSDADDLGEIGPGLDLRSKGDWIEV